MLQRLPRSLKMGLAALITACSTSKQPLPLKQISPPPKKSQVEQIVAKPKVPAPKLKKEFLEKTVKECDELPQDKKIEYLHDAVLQPQNLVKFDRRLRCAEFRHMEVLEGQGAFITYVRTGSEQCYENHSREVKSDQLTLNLGMDRRNTSFLNVVRRGMMVLYMPRENDALGMYALNRDVPSFPEGFEFFFYKAGSHQGKPCRRDLGACKGPELIFDGYLDLFCKEKRDAELRQMMVLHTPQEHDSIGYQYR